MERRTFLKGAAAATAIPVAAFTPANAAGSLGALLDEHAALDELYRMADEREGAIAQDAARPNLQHVTATEIGPLRSGMYPARKAFYSRESIIELFDRERNVTVHWQCHLSPEKRAAVLAKLNEQQERVLELLAVREASYDLWRLNSGYGAAAAETARLANLVGNVEDHILAYRCETIEQVRQKAAFFDRMYGKTAPEGFVDAFVKSLI